MGVRHSIRDIGLKIAPKTMTEILSWRSQRLIMKLERKSGLLKASQEFVQKNGRTVLTGPFEGMTYPDWTSQRRNLVAKLAGSYEDEISTWIKKSSRIEYAQILNVGSADGYYSVGLALLCPQTPVKAFDTDRWAREATLRLAETNGVQNVEVLSMCTPEWLNERLINNSLLLLDCEGYEMILLDPEVCPALRECDLIVELHEHVAPGIEDSIRTWFQSTHKIQELTAKTKRAEDYPEYAGIERGVFERAIDEGRRFDQKWLHLKRDSE